MKQTVLAALAAVAVAGCIDYDAAGVDASPESIWQAEINPVFQGAPDPDAPRVEGSAGAVVLQTGTEVGIGLQGVTETLYWGIFTGTCELPEGRVDDAGAYPPLGPADMETETTLDFALASGETYHVRVAPDQAVSELVACGNFDESAPVSGV